MNFPLCQYDIIATRVFFIFQCLCLVLISMQTDILRRAVVWNTNCLNYKRTFSGCLSYCIGIAEHMAQMVYTIYLPAAKTPSSSRICSTLWPFGLLLIFWCAYIVLYIYTGFGSLALRGHDNAPVSNAMDTETFKPAEIHINIAHVMTFRC